jgi:hypothetical protein
VVTRRRRPHRQGYITNYYLNGSRVSLDTLKSFFAKPLPLLTQYQVELNHLCGALRTEVTAERLPNREKTDRSWSTEQFIDNNRVTKIVDVANGNKVGFKLNGRKIALSKLKNHFNYGELFEEVHDFSQRHHQPSNVAVEEPEIEAEQATTTSKPAADTSNGIWQWSRFWKVVEYVAPYVACAGIFVLMGKMYH